MLGYATVYLIVGLGFWFAAGVFLFAGKRIRGVTKATRSFESRRASEVREVSPGTLVEVTGTVRCENPLASKMTGAECVYYLSRVIREYRDSGGELGREVVASSERYTPFTVEDDSGGVVVSSEGADVQTFEVSLNRVDKNRDGGSVTLGGSTVNFDRDERTTGYRHVEWIIPPGSTVYVIGCVGDDRRIGSSEDESVVIRSSTMERLGSVYKKWTRGFVLGAAGFFVLGLILVGVGLYGLVSLS